MPGRTRRHRRPDNRPYGTWNVEDGIDAGNVPRSILRQQRAAVEAEEQTGHTNLIDSIPQWYAKVDYLQQRSAMGEEHLSQLAHGISKASYPIWDRTLNSQLSTSAGEGYPWNYQWYIQQLAEQG